MRRMSTETTDTQIDGRMPGGVMCCEYLKIEQGKGKEYYKNRGSYFSRALDERRETVMWPSLGRRSNTYRREVYKPKPSWKE
jgi:hypothetical protein